MSHIPDVSVCLQESLLEELRPPLSKEEWDKIIHSSPTSAESTMRIFDTCAEWVEQKYMPSATAEIRTKVRRAIVVVLLVVAKSGLHSSPITSAMVVRTER